MTLKELYSEGTEILEDNDIDSPEVDAFYLLEHVSGTDRAHYLLDKDRIVAPEIAEAYMELINKRAEHIPYQYLTGECEFMGFRMKVSPDVLIPRLDSEVLCEEALKLIHEGGAVLDMCTGSGCLAVALKKLREDVSVWASDISANALRIARENASINGADVTFAEGDLFEGIDKGCTFDVIVSNPPYVTEEEYLELSPEVAGHEPKLALTAGADGLDIYRRLIPQARGYLREGGWLIMEMGCSQGLPLTDLMEQYGYKRVSVVKDLAGLDRVICGAV